MHQDRDPERTGHSIHRPQSQSRQKDIEDLDGLHVEQGKQDCLDNDGQPFRHGPAQLTLDNAAEKEFFTERRKERDAGDQPTIAKCR